MRKLLILIIVFGGLGYGGYRWYQQENTPTTQEGMLTLYGNVDLRDIELAFMDVERVRKVYVEEGDSVIKGQILAELETDRLRKAISASKASVEAQEFVVTRLENGSRPEEIAKAIAEVQSANSELVVAERTFARKLSLLSRGATTQQDVDDARTVRDVAKARLEVAQKQKELVVAGPRWEDIKEAQARLAALQAELQRLEVQLEESRLRATRDSIVRSRNLEPGDMASPQKPVFTLAVLDPKWVRTYVPESDLGKLKPGMSGWVTIDSWPDRRYAGWVGFISPMAEFTPRSVETPELRTSLVYEVRFMVDDPENDLRLGMPATVHITTEKNDATESNQGNPPAGE